MIKLLFIFLILYPSKNINSQTNQEFSINGYLYSTNNNFKKGLRLKEIGNFFYRKKAYAQSIPYYEKALKYIPTEADISFQLAEIYYKKKLWRLSELYYSETIELLKNPMNFGKSQLNSYLSQIRIAKIYHIQNRKEVLKQTLINLRKQESTLKSLYNKAWDEFTNYFNDIYPKTAIRSDTNQ